MSYSKYIGLTLFFSLLFFFSTNPAKLFAQSSELLDILEEEIDREMDVLGKAKTPAYYLDYRINEIEYVLLSSSFGSLIQSSKDKNRVLTTTVRVGDYQLDNSHENRGGFGGGLFGQRAGLPLENNPKAIKQALWRATNNEYQRAKEQYKLIEEEKDEDDSDLPDFSKEKPVQFTDPDFNETSQTFDLKDWEKRIKSYSSLFQGNKNIISGNVGFSFNEERKYYVSSEGAKVGLYNTYAYLRVEASIMAEEGDIIPLYRTYFASHPDKLPAGSLIEQDVKTLIEKLEALRKAPLAEPYTGPAILLARSSGVFFHEIFGHRVEGHRLKQESDGQTFKERLNKEVLPKSVSIYFDPTMSTFNGKDLNGTYKYDDEGVKARRVDIVQKGELKNFLMSRTPLESAKVSNGHGRAAAGFKPVSRQSNLMVESSKTSDMNAMRKMLIKECKRQDKKYGYLFSDVTGGFTNTDRYSPNAFNVTPTEVYRIYVDGRPDELVRGVNLIGTPLAMFAEIKALGDDPEIFTGFCGAESGSVPVSAIAPSIFVRRIETQKKPNLKAESSILERPYLIDNQE